MHCDLAISSVSPVSSTAPVDAVASLQPIDALAAPVDVQPYATFASTTTGYDRWPAVFDAAAASLAAAASAQHLKTFWQSPPPRERRR